MEASRLLRFSRQFERFYAARFVPLLERMGWNMAEVHVLLFLANNPGRDTARDVATLRGLAKSQVSQAVELLAKLHLAMEMPSDTPGLPETFCPGKEYEKHNREMKRIRKYLKQKGQKQTFEMKLLSTCDFFINQALDITREWNQYSASFEEEKEPCESEKKIV